MPLRERVSETAICEQCGYDWAAPIENAVAVIGNFPAALAQLMLDLGITDSSRLLRTRPGADLWSPLEYIAHTGDAIDWYYGRIDRVLTERQPTLDPFDWDQHTAAARYSDLALSDALAVVERVCAAFMQRTTVLSVRERARVGIGSGGQPRSVAVLCHRAAHEARHHLDDIRTGLGHEAEPL